MTNLLLERVGFVRCLLSRSLATLSVFFFSVEAISQTANVVPVEKPAIIAPVAATEPSQLPKVEVTGRSDGSERVGVTRVVSRKDLESALGRTVTEVLNGVDSIFSINGRLYMQGQSAGVTVLLDGLIPPRGFSITSLSLDQIEKIEIFPNGNVQFSASANGGIINIISRKAVKKETKSFTARADHGSESQAQRLAGSFGTSSGPTSWFLSANINNTFTAGSNEAFRYRLLPTLRKDSQFQTSNFSQTWVMATAAFKISTSITEDSKLVLQSELTNSNIASKRLTNVVYDTPVSSASTELFSRSDATTHRSTLTFSHAFSDKTTAELNIHYKGNKQQTFFNRSFKGIQGVANGLETESDVSDFATPMLFGHVSTKLFDRITATMGFNLEQHRFRESIGTTFVLGSVENPNTNSLIKRHVERSVYAKGEFDLNDGVSVEFGGRFESVKLSETGALSSNPIYAGNFFAPQLQLLWKPSSHKEYEVRFDVSKDWNSPLGLATNARRISLENSFFSPDQIGKTDLAPEIYTKFSLSVAHKTSPSKSNTFTLIVKSGKDLTSRQRQFVDGRWIDQYLNLPRAMVIGLEATSKFTLHHQSDKRDYDIRPRIGIYTSRVEGIPGPNNRVDSQIPFLFSLNIDQKQAAVRWFGGGSFSYSKRGSRAISNFQSEFQNDQKTLEFYLARKFWNSFTFRVSGQMHLLPLIRSQTYSSTDGSVEFQQTTSPRPTRISVELIYRPVN